MAYGVCLYLVILIWRDSLSDSINGFSPLSLNTYSWGSGCYSSSQAHLCSHNYSLGDHSLGCSLRRSSPWEYRFSPIYWLRVLRDTLSMSFMVRVWWGSSHQDTSFAMCFWWWIIQAVSDDTTLECLMKNGEESWLSFWAGVWPSGIYCRDARVV